MLNQDEKRLLGWLVGQGGPAIRYRTAVELLESAGKIDITRLQADLLAMPMVGEWLARLGTPGVGLNSLHGSRPELFENASAKLADLGLRAGMSALDEHLAPWRDWLAEQASLLADLPENIGLAANEAETEQVLAVYTTWYYVVLVGARLTWLGYPDMSLRTLFPRRLDALYSLAVTGNHDIYMDQDTFGDYPNNSFRKRPLVNPRFYGGLPSIHDIYALAHYPPELLDETTRRKIDAVIDYLLHPDYQAFDEGYGVMRAGPRRYFSMGWSIHLPGYQGFELDDSRAAMLVQRLELMARFPAAVRHPYFAACLAHLESFYTVDDRYRFPGRYLRESAAGYWVNGAYMRLEGDRKAPLALALDSTFRMALIHKLAFSHADAA